MTQRDESNSCPRCGRPVELRVRAGTIKPHRDPLIGCACPTEGMTPAEAKQWVADARRRIAEMAR